MGYLDNTGLAYLWGKIKAKLVQPDWQQNDETAPDYVKNRPGGFDEYDVNITWDGVVGDRLTVELDGGYYVKVSDITPSKSDLLGGKLSAINKVEELNNVVSLDDDNMIEKEGALALSEGAVIIYNPPVSFEGLSFTEGGVWFRIVFYGSEAIGAFVNLLQSAPIPINIPQRYLALHGYAQKNETILTIPQVHTLEEKQQARANIGLIPVAKTDAMTQSVGYDAETGKLWTVPPTGDNIVLASSTTGSTKKFRITVDDSGTLSAVEVTDAS